MTPAHRHTTGIVRREFLQVGFSGFLGLGLPGLLAGRGDRPPSERPARAGEVGDPGLPDRRARATSTRST